MLTILNALHTTPGMVGLGCYCLIYLALAFMATKDWWDGDTNSKGEIMSFNTLMLVYFLLLVLMPLVMFWMVKGSLEKARMRHLELLRRRNRPIEETFKELNEFYEDNGMPDRVAMPERLPNGRFKPRQKERQNV